MTGRLIMKLFGREPALWASLATSLVSVLVAADLPWLTAGQGAALIALIGAVVIAITTRPVAPALFTGIVAAAAALVAEYGLDLSDALTTAVSATVLSVCALLGVRPQVSPQDTPVSRG